MQGARRLTRRHFREREGRFLIEGPRVLDDAIAAGASVREVFVVDAELAVVATARASGAQIHEVSEPVLRALSDATSPQDVVAVADLPTTSLEVLDVSTGLILVLAEIRDPGNAGTLVRSAAASGCGGVVFATGSVDPFGPKTLRAAAGAVFRIPIVAKVELTEALQFLRAAGFALVGADARSDVSVYDVDLSKPSAIVLGNESWGLPDPDAGDLDVIAGIPMPGAVESLNVGVAGSLFLFEAARRRQIGSGDS